MRFFPCHLLTAGQAVGLHSIGGCLAADNAGCPANLVIWEADTETDGAG
jgi:hypothetical protein